MISTYPMADIHNTDTQGPGKRGHIVADTLLPTQMFPRLPARATFVADTNFVSVTQKMFLILFKNILCLQQMFPSLHSPRNIMGNNVSSFTTPGPSVVAVWWPSDYSILFEGYNQFDLTFPIESLLARAFRRLVSSVGRAPDYSAGGRGFEPQTGPTLTVLK